MSSKRIDLDSIDARYRAYERAGGAGASDVLRLVAAIPGLIAEVRALREQPGLFGDHWQGRRREAC